MQPPGCQASSPQQADFPKQPPGGRLASPKLSSSCHMLHLRAMKVASDRKEYRLYRSMLSRESVTLLQFREEELPVPKAKGSKSISLPGGSSGPSFCSRCLRRVCGPRAWQPGRCGDATGPLEFRGLRDEEWKQSQAENLVKQSPALGTSLVLTRRLTSLLTN